MRSTVHGTRPSAAGNWRRIKPCRVRAAFVPLFAALLAARAGTPNRAAIPMVEGKPVKLEMRITNRFWELDVRRAAADLARQSAGALDAPLRLDLVVRPGQLKDGELSMEVLKRGDDG
jgi:hypothetical protein